MNSGESQNSKVEGSIEANVVSGRGEGFLGNSPYQQNGEASGGGGVRPAPNKEIHDMSLDDNSRSEIIKDGDLKLTAARKDMDLNGCGGSLEEKLKLNGDNDDIRINNENGEAPATVIMPPTANNSSTPPSPRKSANNSTPLNIFSVSPPPQKQNSQSSAASHNNLCASPPPSNTNANSPPSSPDGDDSILMGDPFPPLPPVPQIDRPSALRLAKRLFNLEGFKKQDVSRQLSKKNDFSHIVAELYFNQFNLINLGLDAAIREFLSKCILVGETQEREKVLMYFSQRYLDCNPHLLQTTFRSQDSLHTLTCAVVLLNTDLHNLHNVQMKKMSSKDFSENLTGLNEGENFDPGLVLSLYTSIRNKPLDSWTGSTTTPPAPGGQDNEDPAYDNMGGAVDSNTEDPSSDNQSSRVSATSQVNPANSVSLSGQQAGGINPFLALPDSNGVEYKRGYIVRKCCYDANGKRTKMGKRGWRMFYVTLRDLVLFCFKDEKACEQPGAFSNPQVALRLHSALAHKALDYQKRKHVFRLILADRAQFLFRTTSEEELDAWVTVMNTVTARYSSPPLPAGCSSNTARFQRPLYPSSCSQLSLDQQIQQHQAQLQQVHDQLDELTTADTESTQQQQQETAQQESGNNTANSSAYQQELVKFLLSEKERYKVYILSLQNLQSTPPSNQGALPPPNQGAPPPPSHTTNQDSDFSSRAERDPNLRSHSTPPLHHSDKELLPPPATDSGGGD